AGTTVMVTDATVQAEGRTWVPVVTPDGRLAGYVAADFLAPAQEATPAAGALPVTPGPAECRAEPRPVAEVLAINAEATPTAGRAETETFEVPVGAPVDTETVAGVTATVREVFACFNAGDVRRAFSLLTDERIRDFVEEDPISEEELRGFLEATPEAVPAEQQLTLLAVSDVTELEDGRVGAFVVTTDPLAGPDTIYVVVVQADDRWLVDDVIEFLAGGEGGEATPTPQPDPSPTTVRTVTAGNLRAAPSRQAAIVTVLAAGTELTVTGATERAEGRTWVPVVTPDGRLTGYVAADFLAPA
ncbi:MAG: SH3 domain-containing protein, partial [Chloroflexota bacterium]|nr:SH3 domain-containing protein [Chloroflexota bacterium]